MLCMMQAFNTLRERELKMTKVKTTNATNTANAANTTNAANTADTAMAVEIANTMSSIAIATSAAVSAIDNLEIISRSLVKSDKQQNRLNGIAQSLGEQIKEKRKTFFNVLIEALKECQHDKTLYSRVGSSLMHQSDKFVSLIMNHKNNGVSLKDALNFKKVNGSLTEKKNASLLLENYFLNFVNPYEPKQASGNGEPNEPSGNGDGEPNEPNEPSEPNGSKSPKASEAEKMLKFLNSSLTKMLKANKNAQIFSDSTIAEFQTLSNLFTDKVNAENQATNKPLLDEDNATISQAIKAA